MSRETSLYSRRIGRCDGWKRLKAGLYCIYSASAIPFSWLSTPGEYIGFLAGAARQSENGKEQLGFPS